MQARNDNDDDSDDGKFKNNMNVNLLMSVFNAVVMSYSVEQCV